MEPEPTTVIRMPRPTWKPTTDDQRALLAELDKKRAKVDEDTNELWKVIEAGRGLGIPSHLLAERGGVSRSTVYRRLREPESDSED